MTAPAHWQRENTVVFGPAAAPIAWTDLDLSAVVGSRRVLVLIHIDPSTGNDKVGFRPNDDADDYFVGAGSSSSVFYNSASGDSSVLVVTDSQGKVEWVAGAASTITLTVIGYVINPSSGVGTTISSGALAGAAWNGIDCSAVVGSQRAFIFLKILSTNAWNANECWITRAHSDADNWVNTAAFTYASANRVKGIGNAKVSTLCVQSDATGEIEIYSALGTGTADVEIVAYVPESALWRVPTGSGNVFGPANAPMAWTDLDLSPVIGAQYAFVLLKVDRISAAAVGIPCRFRENGMGRMIDAGNDSPQANSTVSARTSFVIVPTDEAGICEWDIDAAFGVHQYELTVIGWLGAPSDCDEYWSVMKTTGRGRVAIFVEIAGLPDAFATVDEYPHVDDAWFYGVYDDCLPWLAWKNQRIILDEKASFLEGTIDVSPVEIAITDLDGQMTQYVASNWYRNMTRLTVTLTAAGVTATVDSTTNFAASGVIWIGLEAIGYTGITPTTFTGLIRGVYGTEAVEHVADIDARPIPVLPAVLDGPQFLAGRRCNIRAAAVGRNGCIGPSEVIFRGHIGPDIEPGEGLWPLQVDHITSMWSRTIGEDMGQGSVRPGYWYSGNASSLSKITIVEHDINAGTEIVMEPTVAEGYYASPSDLCDAIAFTVWTIIGAVGTKYITVLYSSDENAYVIKFFADANCESTIRVREGDPLWALGFEAGNYVGERSGAATYISAQNDPKLFVLDAFQGATASARPLFWMDDVYPATFGQYAMIGENPYMQIASGDPVGHGEGYRQFAVNSMDPLHRQQQKYIAVDKQEDLVLKLVFRFGRTDTIYTALEKMLSLDLSTGEPRSWRVNGITSADINLSELEDCLKGLPPGMTRYHDAITEPAKLCDLICPRLGMLGIAPRITVAGAGIGFARLQTPAITNASAVEIDEDVWEKTTASTVKSKVEGVPLLSSCEAQHTYNYLDKKYTYSSRVSVRSVANERGKTFTRVYTTRGLQVSSNVSLNLIRDEVSLAHAMAVRMVGSHLGLFSRMAPVVPIPCSWPAISVALGDIVKVTHPCVVDVTEGGVGVSDRLGVVVSRQATITQRQINQLGIQMPQRINAACIAPAALSTGWAVGTLTLTFGSTTVYQTGGSDLTEFLAGMDVRFTEYDVDAPLTWTGTISSVGANTVILTADPFVINPYPATGVVMTWRSYDNCSTSQQAWLFFCDSGYTLGAAGDEGYQWGI